MDSLAEKKERLGDEALLHCKSVTAWYVSGCSWLALRYIFKQILDSPCSLKLQQGKSDEVKVLISANQIILDGLQGADPAVHSKFYQSASEYYKVLFGFCTVMCFVQLCACGAGQRSCRNLLQERIDVPGVHTTRHLNIGAETSAGHRPCACCAHRRKCLQFRRSGKIKLPRNSIF